MELVAVVNNGNKTNIAEKLLFLLSWCESESPIESGVSRVRFPKFWKIRESQDYQKFSWKWSRKTIASKYCHFIQNLSSSECVAINLQIAVNYKIQVTRLSPRTPLGMDIIIGYLKTGTYCILDAILIHTSSNIHIYFTLEAEWPFLCLIRSSCPHTYWK